MVAAAVGVTLACALLGGARVATALPDSISEAPVATVQGIWGNGDTSFWQQRFLTDPSSRIVVNADDNNGENLPKGVLTASQASPLNLAYLAPESKQNVRDALQVTDDVSAPPADPGSSTQQHVAVDLPARSDSWNGAQTNTALSFANGCVSFPFKMAKSWAIARSKSFDVTVDDSMALDAALSFADARVSFEVKLTIGGKDYSLGSGLKAGEHHLSLAAAGIPKGAQHVDFVQVVMVYRDDSGKQVIPSQEIPASFSDVRIVARTGSGADSEGSANSYRTEMGLPADNRTWRDQAHNHPTFSEGPVMNLEATDSFSVADLVQPPYVQITPSTVFEFTVDSVSGGTIEAKARISGKELKLQTGIDKPGTYRLNLYKTFGSSALGYQQVDLMLAVVTRGAKASFSKMSIRQASDEIPAGAYASSYQTSWRPDYLGFSASFPSGMEVKGSDYFYDANTVVRDLTVNGRGNLHIAGAVLDGDVACSGTGVSSSSKTVSAAVAFSVPAGKIAYFKSYDDMRNDRDPSDSPIPGGVFYADFSNLKNGRLVIAYRMQGAGTAHGDELLAKASSAAADALKRDVRGERTAEANAFYSKIPVPAAVDFAIDAKGVTKQDEMRSYYLAWDIIRATLMPQNTENGFDHVAFAASKAHMWADADKRAWYSAAWECFYGMMMYSYVDSDTAWDAFQGQMSLVDGSGVLGGEGLPVNRARTALVLYGNSGKDKGASQLAMCYQAIDRNLRWALENPHWVDSKYGGGPDQKDVDFLAAALVDIPYMERIYRILGDTGKIAKAKADDSIQRWEKTRSEYLDKYQEWNFRDGKSYGKVNVNGQGAVSSLDPGNDQMVLKGLFVQDIDDATEKILLQRFGNAFDPLKDFGGFDRGKYEEFAYMVYGLMQRGRVDDANKLLQASVRDIVRSHSMGEVLCMGSAQKSTVLDGNPYVDGVAPSTFGAAQLIDSMWMLNGYHFESGTLTVANNRAGSVSNIRRAGHVWSFRSDGKTVISAMDGQNRPPLDFKTGYDAVDLEGSSAEVPDAPEADKRVLAALISQAWAIGPTGYDEGAWKALQKSIENAKRVQADRQATDADVSGAIQGLKSARAALGPMS